MTERAHKSTSEVEIACPQSPPKKLYPQMVMGQEVGHTVNY